MVAIWIGLPIAVRLALVAILGLLGGGLANYLIYRFAYFNPRAISPWGPTADGAPPRRAGDRVPVLGWFGLRREVEVHGRGFWIRPMLIELGTAAGLVGLYWFETQVGGLLPEELRNQAFLAAVEPYLTRVFFAHAVLVVLMVAATFIDFDERTIPDVITIPGTLLALLLATSTTQIYMPSLIADLEIPLLPTTFDAPWFEDGGWGDVKGLWAGLAIWSVWCFALADWRWSSPLMRRRGLSRAIRHFVDGLFHYGFWKVLFAIWLVGVLAITGVWRANGLGWDGLFSALVGLAAGGGVIWAIRVVATWALNMEAMGFGDVTLMAMIGAMIGWQAALIAFFLSPFAAIVIVLTRYIVTRDAYTPFGPYLCAGTLMTIVGWDRFYGNWLAGNLMLMGSMLIWICLSMLGLMAFMLFVWRNIKMMFLRDR